MDLTQSFFLLKSLKENLPDEFRIERKWVGDFHSILDTVEKETGFDLGAFRVGQDDLSRPAISRNPMTGTTTYSKVLMIERTRLLHKVDAALSYFEFVQGQPKQSIGFRKV
jgi:hypothetical protein